MPFEAAVSLEKSGQILTYPVKFLGDSVQDFQETCLASDEEQRGTRLRVDAPLASKKLLFFLHQNTKSYGLTSENGCK